MRLYLLLLAVKVVILISLVDSANSKQENGTKFSGKYASLYYAAKNKTRRTYPLTEPMRTVIVKYRIGILADLDKDSKTPRGKWISHLKKGNLSVQFNHAHPTYSIVEIEWDRGEPTTLTSGYNLDGRGMELSELLTFNGELITCDDRTGLVFRLIESGSEIDLVTWEVLADGDGNATKGFKCEWGTVKGGDLWIGGIGTTWNTSKGLNHNPQFVKKITPEGVVTHIDWRGNYEKMLAALNLHYPGYAAYESGGWSDIHQRWMFLPRRVSNETYNSEVDEWKGSNLLITADEYFEDIQVRRVGGIVPTHGFSSFKWIPDTFDQLVVALKSEEVGNVTATYVMVFDMEGDILMEETKVADEKYEGIEFI